MTMFRQLKSKLLRFVLFSISIILLGVFALIFVVTYSSQLEANKTKLQTIANSPRGYVTEYRNGMTGPMHGQIGKLQINDSVSFTVLVQNNMIKKVYSFVDLEETSMINAINQSKNLSNYNTVIVENEHWMVLKSKTSNTMTTQYAFLNVTESVKSTQNLLYTLVASFVVSLVAVYFASKMFAKKAITPVEQAYEKQKRFIADVSHELKTPLSVIKANLEIIDDESSETQKKWIKTVSFETDRMNQLINQMLRLAQSEKQEVLTLDTINISALVKEVLLSFEAVAFEKDLTIVSTIDESVFHKSHTETLRQILFILLDNAIKYSPAHQQIDIVLTKNDKTMEVKICNTNQSLQPSDLEHLFDRFYRKDDARERNDSYGLGLSIAKSLIIQLNGELSVSLTNNNRICFKINLF